MKPFCGGAKGGSYRPPPNLCSAHPVGGEMQYLGHKSGRSHRFVSVPTQGGREIIITTVSPPQQFLLPPRGGGASSTLETG